MIASPSLCRRLEITLTTYRIRKVKEEFDIFVCLILDSESKFIFLSLDSVSNAILLRTRSGVQQLVIEIPWIQSDLT